MTMSALSRSSERANRLQLGRHNCCDGVERVDPAFVRFALVREAAADATVYGSL
jgi:hypothetical protein